MGWYWDNGKENGNYYSILGLYWGYTGIMERNMETTNYLEGLCTCKYATRAANTPMFGVVPTSLSTVRFSASKPFNNGTGSGSKGATAIS